MRCIIYPYLQKNYEKKIIFKACIVSIVAPYYNKLANPKDIVLPTHIFIF